MPQQTSTSGLPDTAVTAPPGLLQNRASSEQAAPALRLTSQMVLSGHQDSKAGAQTTAEDKGKQGVAQGHHVTEQAGDATQ